MVLGCSAILSFRLKSLHTSLQGLNTSRMLAFVFDPVRLYRGYALTDEGDLLAVVVPHENRGTVCKASVFHCLPDMVDACAACLISLNPSIQPVSHPSLQVSRRSQLFDLALPCEGFESGSSAIDMTALRGYLIVLRCSRQVIDPRCPAGNVLLLLYSTQCHTIPYHTH
jgi:hypothetical protein